MPPPLSPRALHRRRGSALPLFAFLQTLVLLFLGHRFTQLLGPEPALISYYLHATWYLYIAVIGVAFAMLLRLFAPLPRLGLFVAALGAAPLAVYFYLDFPVVQAFRVHASELMVRLAMAGSTHSAIAAFAPEQLKITLLQAAGLELILAFVALRLAYAGIVLRFPGWRMLLLVVLLLAADRGYATYTAFQGTQWFTGQTETYPLYVNTTANTQLSRIAERPPITANRRTKQLPDLPLTHYFDEPTDSTAGAPPNILWILVESWRRDALDPEHMPQLTNLLPVFNVASRHVSGGNSTRLGMFSLFYGIHPTPVERLLAEKRGPYFLRRLLADGYNTHIASSEPLDFLGTRETIFIDVDRDVKDNFYYRPAVSDYKAFLRAMKVLDETPAGRPFFNFVFLAATHAKYHTLPGMEPHQPVATRLSVPGTLETHHAETRNRYFNALHFNDELIGRLIAAAMQRKDWENTLVVITGDHGEEFWEHGNFTHSSSFNEEQTAVPLLIRYPHQVSGETYTHLTTHADIVPTLLRYLGDSRPVASYSDGRLLTETAPRWVLQSNWNVYSLFNGQQRITYPGGSVNFLRPLTVSDDHDKALPVQPFVAAHRGAIENALTTQGRFYSSAGGQVD